VASRAAKLQFSSFYGGSAGGRTRLLMMRWAIDFDFQKCSAVSLGEQKKSR
jgi:hypothetical protein